MTIFNPLILAHHQKTPILNSPAYIAPTATLIGEITADEGCSFWFNSVVRADVHWIKIGKRTNVQDHSMLHVSYKKAPLEIGDDVTIGHSCILHGCTLKDRILIGMGSIVMDKAVIESDVIIGAGSLVTEGTVIPAGSLAMGRPAKVVRPLTEEEKTYLKTSAGHYLKVAASYNGGPMPY